MQLLAAGEAPGSSDKKRRGNKATEGQPRGTRNHEQRNFVKDGDIAKTQDIIRSLDTAAGLSQGQCEFEGACN